jgi:hypothetical protein
MKEREFLEHLVVEWRTILKWRLSKVGRMRTIFIWYRVGIIAEHLWTGKARNWLTVYGKFNEVSSIFSNGGSITSLSCVRNTSIYMYIFIINKLYLISAQKHCTNTKILSAFENILLNISFTPSWGFTGFLGSPKHVLDCVVMGYWRT